MAYRGVNFTGLQLRVRGPKSAVTFTVSSLPRYCSGTRHEYEQVNPHPQRRLAAWTSRLLTGLLRPIRL